MQCYHHLSWGGESALTSVCVEALEAVVPESADQDHVVVGQSSEAGGRGRDALVQRVPQSHLQSSG